MAVDMSHKIFTGHFDTRKSCFTHWANLIFADDGPFIIRGANTLWTVKKKKFCEINQFHIPIFVFKKQQSKKQLYFQKIMQEKMLLENSVKLIEEAVLADASRTIGISNFLPDCAAQKK